MASRQSARVSARPYTPLRALSERRRPERATSGLAELPSGSARVVFRGSGLRHRLAGKAVPVLAIVGRACPPGSRIG